MSSRVVGPDGKPRDMTACPVCGSDKTQRVASGGFGKPHPVCTQCGHEFEGEDWEWNRKH